MDKRALIFLDLDSTLIDERYNFKPDALRLIARARTEKVLIAFASSKTYAEQLYFARQLNEKFYMIVENGAAVYYDYLEIERLAKIDIHYIRRVLEEIPFELKYYGNSTIQEIQAFTGLPQHMVYLARDRWFTETIFKGFNEKVKKILEGKGIYAQKGSRFITIGDRISKKDGAFALTSWLIKQGYLIKELIAVGDGENDIPLLEYVDRAYIIGDKIRVQGAEYITSLDEITF